MYDFFVLKRVKMRTIQKIFCTMMLLSVVSPLWALDKNGKFAIKGVGNVSCEQFVQIIENNDPQKFLFAGWLNGYITAHNQHLKDTFDIVSWEDVETLGTYVKGHCAKNPKISFFQATTQLLNEMNNERIVEYVGAENMALGDQSQKTYVQVVKRVQSALKEKGYYKGAEDGIVSEKLNTALNKFRQEHKLPAANYLDQMTLHTLFREK
jgi:hypothetical protein